MNRMVIAGDLSPLSFRLDLTGTAEKSGDTIEQTVRKGNIVMSSYLFSLDVTATQRSDSSKDSPGASTNQQNLWKE